MPDEAEAGDVPTLQSFAQRAPDLAYLLRGDDLLTDLDPQFAALSGTGAVIPSPQEMRESELA
eukprot:2867815-Prymnesium_polylepis.1